MRALLSILIALLLSSVAHAVTIGIGFFTASPNTVSFTMSDPDSGLVTATTPAVVDWTMLGVSLINTPWNLKVHASSSEFTGCTHIPASAVKVTCSSASIFSIPGGTASCQGPFSLSTTPTMLAGGSAAVSLVAVAYKVTITYSINDSWRFVAGSCPLNIVYTLSVD